MEKTQRLDMGIEKRNGSFPEERCLWWNGSWWSRKTFSEKVEAAARSLESGGFRAGERVACFLPNCPTVLVLSVAAWKLGGTVIPLNMKAGTPSILKILRHVEPAGVFLHESMQPLLEILETEGIPAAVVGPEGELPPLSMRPVTREPEDLAVIFATSGTTGDPKAVPLTHSNLLDNATNVHENIEGFETGRVLMNVLPNFHAFGYTICGLLSLLFGLPQVILPSFIPLKSFFEALRATRTEILIAVPTMLPFILGSVAKGEECPDSLKYILTGGGRLDPTLDTRVRDTLGVVVFEGYGLTETSPDVAANRSFASKKLGTVGPALPSFEIQVRDDSGNVLGPNREGLLWVRGPSVFSGYFRSPEMTAERIVSGWFNTDDIVRVDEEGYIEILDRASDLIIVGGFNVYPQEVETILNQVPGVVMSAVIGIPNAVSGEVPKAFVILKEGSDVTAQSIVAYCKEHMAHYKVPRKVEFVSELPLSSVGKVLRRELRRLEKNSGKAS
ncbi:MAG: AMP-binding protein [Synergistales bacterium]